MSWESALKELHKRVASYSHKNKNKNKKYVLEINVESQFFMQLFNYCNKIYVMQVKKTM